MAVASAVTSAAAVCGCKFARNSKNDCADNKNAATMLRNQCKTLSENHSNRKITRNRLKIDWRK